MRKRLLFVALLACSIPLICAAIPRWVNSYGVQNRVKSIVETGNGKFMIIGAHDNMETGFRLLELDADGNILWEKCYQNNMLFGQENIIPTSDGGYLCGSCAFGSGAAGLSCMKLNEKKEMKWFKIYKWSTPIGYQYMEMIQTVDDGYIIRSEVGFDPGSNIRCSFIMKIDGHGVTQWSKIISSEDGSACINSMVPTSNGGLMAVGHIASIENSMWIMKVDRAGNFVWQKSIPCYNNYSSMIVKNLDDTYAILYQNVNDGHFSLLGINENGSILWSKGYFMENIAPRMLKAVGNGGYIIDAIKSRPLDQQPYNILIRTGKQGNIQWQIEYGYTDHPFVVNDIAETSDGGYIETIAHYEGVNWMQQQGFVVKMDSTGDSGIPCLLLDNASVTSEDFVLELSDVSTGTITEYAIEPIDFSTSSWDCASEIAPMCPINPSISSVTKLTDPFRLGIKGAGFASDVKVYIGEDTTPWETVKFKNIAHLILKGGNSLKERFPKGVPVEIKVVNGDGGSASITYMR